MVETVAVGTHAVSYEEESKFICFAHVGELTEADAVTICDAIGQFANKVPADQPTFILADNRKAGSVTKEARQVIVERTKGGVMHDEAYVALYGGSFASRIFINMLMKVMSLATTKMVVHNLATQAEARAWLNDQRTALLSRRA
jgi:hypothetical protein